MVVLALIMVGAKLMGGGTYTILSGSMEPTYHVGSLIIVQPVDHKELKVGDPITFTIAEDRVVTHRIVDIKDYEWFTTKGDANEVEDASPTYYENIIGKPIFSIPYLGYLIYLIKYPPGRYVAIFFGILLIAIELKNHNK